VHHDDREGNPRRRRPAALTGELRDLLDLRSLIETAPQALRCRGPAGQLVLALDRLISARLSPDSGGGMFMS
jgi:hypothetical protein